MKISASSSGGRARVCLLTAASRSLPFSFTSVYWFWYCGSRLERGPEDIAVESFFCVSTRALSAERQRSKQGKRLRNRCR
jgi:hypothetical protein